MAAEVDWPTPLSRRAGFGSVLGDLVGPAVIDLAALRLRALSFAGFRLASPAGR